uniref:Uncharacterized protein n=1 Tax=Lepeophtheirus salmonis TaxID=72036 RepID=A0A0K2UGB5_LEPSM
MNSDDMIEKRSTINIFITHKCTLLSTMEPSGGDEKIEDKETSGNQVSSYS